MQMELLAPIRNTFLLIMILVCVRKYFDINSGISVSVTNDFVLENKNPSSL